MYIVQIEPICTLGRFGSVPAIPVTPLVKGKGIKVTCSLKGNCKGNCKGKGFIFSIKVKVTPFFER